MSTLECGDGEEGEKRVVEVWTEFLDALLE